MTIRVNKTGQIIENAYWWGFNWWVRAWVGPHDATGGFVHLSSDEFTVIK